MDWLVKSGKESIKIKSPDVLVRDRSFKIEVGANHYEATWCHLTKTLSVQTPNGEVNLSTRSLTADYAADTGETELRFDYFSPESNRVEQFHGSVERYVPGSEHRAAAAGAKGKVIKSPLTGKVLAVNVESGQEVANKDVLVIIEAMKMENKVYAPLAGKVENLKVKVGDAVKVGQVLLAIK